MSHKTYAALLAFLMIAVMIYPVTGQEEFEWNRQIPFLGAQPTLVLLVQFSDVKLSISRTQAEQIVKIVDSFVRDASYGKTWLEYTIHPKVITLPKPMSYYGGPSAGAQRGDDNQRILEFHLTTIQLAKKDGVDLSQYKHVITIHAGKDEATGGSANDIWSHCNCVAPKILYFLIEQYGFDTVESELKRQGYDWLVELFMHRTRNGEGRLLSGIETVAEYDFPSVMAHEFTHSMWISDLYVYAKDGYSTGSEVGIWTNMDAGSFFDPPVDIDGWSKYLLGWVEAITVEKDGEYTIHTLDKPDEPHALIMPINDKEYYFIHARRPVKNDAALPGPGILVMKVNKFKNRNVEGEPFMAQLFDANPDTPRECEQYATGFRDPRSFMTLCVKFDAPFYGPDGYSATWVSKVAGGRTYGTYQLNLANSEYVTEEGFRISVLSFDESAGVARIRVSLGGQPQEEGGETTVVTLTRTVTGTATETLYTTTTIVGTETRTVVVTVTTTQLPVSTGEEYISIAIILAALLFTVAIIALGRRRPRMPPPPPPAW
ncbi:hypothetical protein CSUB_C0075 [Candidatus Caldarchaeum subterraneum]|uniref:M6 family metalloprotease domain-containing protein n=1 Tax=Caldiarchaeum subterraneum TaxID=311458 RepID=E6N491_CALS0|nr:hypothetical protein HGMM_F25E12C31 [Candidatus Caldarchaeum subterraneum]BAJ49939.1 hypothetical protein CSUB_C0075 [Candidatus Caldarchaeum subterraneum]